MVAVGAAEEVEATEVDIVLDISVELVPILLETELDVDDTPVLENEPRELDDTLCELLAEEDVVGAIEVEEAIDDMVTTDEVLDNVLEERIEDEGTTELKLSVGITVVTPRMSVIPLDPVAVDIELIRAETELELIVELRDTALLLWGKEMLMLTEADMMFTGREIEIEGTTPLLLVGNALFEDEEPDVKVETLFDELETAWEELRLMLNELCCEEVVLPDEDVLAETDEETDAELLIDGTTVELDWLEVTELELLGTTDEDIDAELREALLLDIESATLDEVKTDELVDKT